MTSHEFSFLKFVLPRQTFQSRILIRSVTSHLSLDQPHKNLTLTLTTTTTAPTDTARHQHRHHERWAPPSASATPFLAAMTAQRQPLPADHIDRPPSRFANAIRHPQPRRKQHSTTVTVAHPSASCSMVYWPTPWQHSLTTSTSDRPSASVSTLSNHMVLCPSASNKPWQWLIHPSSTSILLFYLLGVKNNRIMKNNWDEREREWRPGGSRITTTTISTHNNQSQRGERG